MKLRLSIALMAISFVLITSGCSPKIIEKVVYVEKNCTKFKIPTVGYDMPKNEQFDVKVCNGSQDSFKGFISSCKAYKNNFSKCQAENKFLKSQMIRANDE